MNGIPLDLQRRFEQRWAARFSSPVASAAPNRLERQSQQLAAPGKSKRKTRRVESAGLRSAPSGVDENPRRGRFWLRTIAISIAVFAAWVALSVLTFQDGPDDKPLIVSLLSK